MRTSLVCTTEAMGEADSQVMAMQVVTSRSRHLRIQDKALWSKHQELREKLNFRAIYPYLNECGLLSAFCSQSKLVDGRVTEQERIDAILSEHLTKCDKDDYLKDFVDCLKKSNDGTGDGHLELAQSLEAAHHAAVNNRYDSEYNAREAAYHTAVNTHYDSEYNARK